MAFWSNKELPRRQPTEIERRLAHDTEWEPIRSLGLVDMIHAAWGGHRWEFDPAEGLLTAAQIDALNGAYTCIGWIFTDGGEGRRYLIFDRRGVVGILDHHQEDDWNDGSSVGIVAELEALERGEPTPGSVFVALREALEGAASLFDFSEDDDQD